MLDSISFIEILIILIILFLCIVVPVVIFLAVSALIRKGKRVVRTAPDQIQRSVMRGLEKLDERFPNDPREAARWSSGNDELDLNESQANSSVPDYDPFEIPEESPAEDAPAQVYCSGCGAPLKHGSKKCEYCGQSS